MISTTTPFETPVECPQDNGSESQVIDYPVTPARGRFEAPAIENVEMAALSRNCIQVVIGQFAPLFLDLSLELLPVAFDDIPVHLNLLSRLTT